MGRARSASLASRGRARWGRAARLAGRRFEAAGAAGRPATVGSPKGIPSVSVAFLSSSTRSPSSRRVAACSKRRFHTGLLGGSASPSPRSRSYALVALTYAFAPPSSRGADLTRVCVMPCFRVGAKVAARSCLASCVREMARWSTVLSARSPSTSRPARRPVQAVGSARQLSEGAGRGWAGRGGRGWAGGECGREVGRPMPRRSWRTVVEGRQVEAFERLTLLGAQLLIKLPHPVAVQPAVDLAFRL